MKKTISLMKRASVSALAALLLTAILFTGCSAGGDAEYVDMNGAYDDSFKSQATNRSPMSGVTMGDEMDMEMGDAPEWVTEAENEMIQTPDAKQESEEASFDRYPEDATPSFEENPFISTAKNNTSTFSADVDTASYAYFRKLVNSGYTFRDLRNSGAMFRTEEFINYFKYNVHAPTAENELFGVKTSIIPCPWNAESMLLRVTLQAEEAVNEKGNNLVFLIDVSGSMSGRDKLPLLKKAFSYLVSNLGKNDVVSIVTYSGREAVVLEGCQGSKGEKILKAINGLEASGSTNGEAGLTRAYQLAEQYYIEGGNNRIIMASDGDLNVGITSRDGLIDYISEKRDQGVYLSVLGFGTGNYKDAKMEALADNGNGVYYYIDGESEAEKVFGTDVLGTLYTVAEDVKLQLVFNPDLVSAYRLIGYENRVMENEDFDNDAKDAGEVGASHQVTVCYEIKLAAYENDKSPVSPFVTLRVRHKKPGESLSLLNEYFVTNLEETADEDEKFLTAVIETCMLLHGSAHLGDLTLADVIRDLDALDLSEYPERAEFRVLLNQLAQ